MALTLIHQPWYDHDLIYDLDPMTLIVKLDLDYVT